MRTEAELCIDVIDAFKTLKTQLSILKHQVCEVDKTLPAWFQAPPEFKFPSGTPPRMQLFRLIEQLEYLDHQNPKEILVGAGLVAASIETLQAVEALNLAKAHFKKSVIKLKNNKISTSSDFLTGSFEKLLPKSDPIRQTLSRMGMARLHLKQCYRSIPFFSQKPQKVSWTWANTRSIKRITIQDAKTMLEKHPPDPGITYQLQKLTHMALDIPLAIIQELAPHLRANIVMPEITGKKRLMVKGPVPLFYLSHSNDVALPDFKPPKPKKGKDQNRAIRSDLKIDPIPFLPAIRAHLYLDQSEIP